MRSFYPRSFYPTIAFACVSWVMLIGDSQMAHGEIKIPNLNPFAKRQLGQPSALQRLNAGTKKIAGKTANFLTFGKYDPNRKSTNSRVRVTGTQRTYRPGWSSSRTAPRETEKSGLGSWLPSWPSWLTLKNPEPEPGPTTVSEWLKQPRPGIGK